MSIPTFQAAGTATNSTVSPAACSWPTHQTNDFALLIVWSLDVPLDSTPSGWTLVAGGGTGGAGIVTSYGCWVYSLRATSNSMADASLSWTITQIESINHVILTFRGCDTTTDPVNASGTNANGTLNTSVSITGVTTTINDCLIVAIAGSATPSVTHSSWTDASLASVTEIHDSLAGGVATGTLATSGASGTVTATRSGNSRSQNVCIALKGPLSTSGAFFEFFL